MRYSKIFSVSTSDGPSNGLISKLKEKYHTNNFVKISACDFDGTDSDILTWGKNCQIRESSLSPNPVFLTYSFPKLAIKLTNFSFQTAKESCYSLESSFYGANQEKTVILQNLYLYDICGLPYCNSEETNFYSVLDSTTLFTSFTFLSYNGSCPLNAKHFASSGIDFFGTLYQILPDSIFKMKIYPTSFLFLFFFL